MLFSLAAALLVLQASPDTTPTRSGAYFDPAARNLVQEARERRATVEGAIQRYRTLAKSRISLGIRAFNRDRMLYRCESAVRVDWRRGAAARVEVLGAREVMPMFSSKLDAEDDDCIGSVFDPADDRLSMGMGGLVGADSAFVRHPLARGSEAHYRFRSGDTTTIRLPGGRAIRLVELQVVPRRSEARLVSGSLWLEQDSRAVVRAVLRLARPYDFATDKGPAQVDDDDDVPGFLQPLRGDIRHLALEYSLHDGIWWLPRAMTLRGEGQAGTLGRFPLEVEQTYESYEVEGTPGQVVLAAGPALDRKSCRTDVKVTIGAGGGVEKESRRTDSVPAVRGEAPPGTRVKSSCQCNGNRCLAVDRIVPNDTASLLSSPHLPPSIYSEGEALLSRREMEEILAQVQRSAPVPWQRPRPEFRWASPDLLRFNRVEGLSVGARVDLDLGRAVVDGTLRLGVADLFPQAEVGVTQTTGGALRRGAGYLRLNAMGQGSRALGLGNSLGALLFGRDDGDYFRAAGVELLRSPADGADGLHWRVFAERQWAAGRNTNFSLASLLGDGGFRENLPAASASQAGAELTLRASRGLNPAGWRGSAALSLRGEAGTFQFAQPWLSLRGNAPLPGGLVGSLAAAGGTTLGDAPVQSLWFLGGPATVRGYSGDTRRGSTYWNGRAEVARGAPGFRFVLFSDAGWAGPRDRIRLEPLLLSAGVGVSLLDGLLRVDLARALREPRGWRLDLHMDASL